MLSNLRKLIGNIHVVEEGNFIRIEGLLTYQYVNDLARIWRTSKIGLNMFSKVTGSYVVFHKFFLPEVLYTLEGVLDDPKRGNAFNYRAMRKAIEELKRETWWAGTQRHHPSILDFRQLDNLKIKLFETQLGFLETYDVKVPQLSLRGYLLAADPGTGKTINSLAWTECLHSDMTVVICPKNVADRVWNATISSIFKKTPDFWSSVSGTEPTPGKRFYVFHYEQLDKAVEFFKKYPSVKPTVILDECHNLNDIDSLRTQLFIQLCRDSLKNPHVLWMSGTPVKALGKEVVPLLSTIDPFFDKHAEERFLLIFGKSSSKGLDILANRLGMLTHKVTKATVVTSVIERQEVKVAVPNGKQYTLSAVSEEMRSFVSERMEYYRINFHKYESYYNEGCRVHEKQIAHNQKAQQQYEIYRRYIRMIRTQYDPETMKEESKFCNRYEKEMLAGFAQPLKDNFRNAKSVVKYYNLKVQGEALGRILGKRRMQCNLAIAEHADFEPEIDAARKKTVMFTSYVEVVDRIYERLVEAGYKPLRVYGATNHDLTNIISTFEKDPDVNPLLATFQSLSTGVPLTMASTAFMMNQPFRIGELEQTEARLDRVGQDGAIKFLTMLLDTKGEPNLSTRSADILEWSRSQVEQIMGIKVDAELTTESNFDPMRHLLEDDAWDEDAVGAEVVDMNQVFGPEIVSADRPVSLRW